jgi:hypothetical protein
VSAYRAALIHRARLVGVRRVEPAERDAQGAYETEAFAGPWIRARVMERGAVAAKRRRRPEESTEARVERGYELLLDYIYLAGDPVAKPTAAATFETDCPILDNPTIVLSGEPEHLNDGRREIGWMCWGDVPKERS